MSLFKRILFLLIYFYFTFTFTFESFNMVQRIIIYSVPSIYIFLNLKLLKNKLSFKDKYLRISFICYGTILIVSIILPIVYSTYDFSYLNYALIFIKLGLKNIMLLIIFLKMYNEKSTVYKYAKYYIMSCCVYICITIIMISFPDFTSFWMSIIHTDSISKVLMLEKHNISRVGIDGFAGFQQTFMCSIGVILNVYMIISNNSKFKKNHFTIYISLCMLIIGTLLYGRIGSLISFAAIVALIIYYLTKQRNIKKAMAMIGIIMILTSSLIYIAKGNEKVNTWLNWSFDYVSNFKNGGKLSNASIEMMVGMYFVPETRTLLIGDGYYTDQTSGLYYKNADIGFMRNILFFGVFLTIISYSSNAFILFGLKKRFSQNKNKVGVIISIFFFFQMILFEMKGGIHFLMFANLLPFYLLLLYENDHKEIKELSDTQDR